MRKPFLCFWSVIWLKKGHNLKKFLLDRILPLKDKDPDQFEEIFNTVMAKWDERNAPEASASADTDEKKH